MLIWARSYLAAKSNGLQMIWPEWSQIHLGSWLRWERDKRLYGKLFIKPHDYADYSNVKHCLMVSEKDYHNTQFEVQSDSVVIFEGIEQGFEPLCGHGEVLWNELCRIAAADLVACKHAAADVIGLGIRLADAKSAGWSAPIDWFEKRLIELRKLRPDQPVWIFSDGSDSELASLFRYPLVTRAPAWRDPLESIAQMSGTKAMIVTGGSSFYRWGVLLGNVPVLASAVDKWHVDIWSRLSHNGQAVAGGEEPNEGHWTKLLSGCS